MRTSHITDNGVLYGFDCTAQGGNAKVDFREGGITVDGVFTALASLGNVTVPANTDPDFFQKTRYTVDASGTPAIVSDTGDPGDMDLATITPFNTPHYDLYDITMPPSTSIVAQSYIEDIRHLASVVPGPYQISTLWVGGIDRTTTSNAWASGDCFLQPYFFNNVAQISNLGVWCTSAGTAGSKARLGLYREANDDGSAGLTLINDAGQVAVDATGARTAALSGNTYVGPGWYWFACAFQSLGVTKPTMERALVPMNTPVGGATLTQQGYGFRYASGITGNLPATISNASSDFSKIIVPLIQAQFV